MRETVTISLPKELRKELDSLAKREGIPRSILVQQSLRHYLFSRWLKKTREELIPLAQSKGIYTDEDVFKLVS